MTKFLRLIYGFYENSAAFQFKTAIIMRHQGIRGSEIKLGLRIKRFRGHLFLIIDLDPMDF